MKVDFVTIVSASYSATASAKELTVEARVNVRDGKVENIQSGTVTRADGVCVGSFTVQNGGSKDVSFYSDVNVDESELLAAINGFIAGAAATASEKQKGGEA